jgi:diaminohydroxyphosphoribosylaminopyrimidine deaminase/5-amino-6-(5-phosphoribosylamino)uracil reductase
MVGAVIVKNGRIVGEGYHRRKGEPHAEALALDNAGERARGGDLYVNLEPCCHHGHTPPCTDAILEAGIRRVWVATMDPNPLVHGKGIRFLRRNGIEVDLGLLEEEAVRLNEFYLTWVRTGRPFVIVKLASTLDGKIATAAGESRWISSPGSRRYTHRLRHEVDSIMVGVGTVVADDPELTVRMGIRRPRHPVRVVLDTNLRTPADAKVLDASSGVRTILACGRNVDPGRVEELRSGRTDVWSFATDSKGRVRILPVLRRLGREGLTSMLVEGGREVAASLLRAGVVDKLVMAISPKLLGSDGWDAVGDLGIRKLARALTLGDVRSRQIDGDIIVTGYLHPKKDGIHVHGSG